ncbi:hypothetical protein CICLE_v10003377mg [Citrus x clementina]|uniref:Uncharacterized protein n=1 Tax=Citrus clementina TaxID=85681 RepID=V4V332_CITCL|nr:hypothetical protein CICLE_v10003377mg [Citrus x clementina]
MIHNASSSLSTFYGNNETFFFFFFFTLSLSLSILLQNYSPLQHQVINNGFSNLKISTVIKENQTLLAMELVMVYCRFACAAGAAGFRSRWS